MHLNSFLIQNSKKGELFSGKSFPKFDSTLNPTLPPSTQKLRWKDSSLDLRIPEDATEDWIKEEIFLQETILNKLHNYMQGKKV